MEAPKVELKKYKSFKGMEGNGYNAEVWINGVNCIQSMDDGNGGCYRHYQNFGHKDQKLVEANIKLLNDYIEAHPRVKYASLNLKYDMDMFMDEQINKLELERQAKKQLNARLKLQQTAFLVGEPNGDGYQYARFKVPLSKIPLDVLQKQYNLFKAQHCTLSKGNNVILNTNLEALGIVL